MSQNELCTTLSWDSDFFGVRIARINGDSLTPGDLATVDAWCAGEAIDCAYYLSRADDPLVLAAAQASGFRLMDVRVTYERPLPGRPVIPGAPVRTARPEDLPTLRRIARISHTDTRFYADARFPRAKCDELYDTWVSRSCDGYADVVWVADVDGAPVGYLTCSLDRAAGRGTMVLMALDEAARGRGLGQAFVSRSLEWFIEQGMTTAAVVTAGRNVVAQRLYQKNGYMLTSTQLWFHKWYTPAV